MCVNLYPFERTVARQEVSEEEAVENIDVGGPTMIRAAAKNHRFVAVVVTPESYDAVLAELEESDGSVTSETRHWLANEAFALTARYDAAISRWFGSALRVVSGPLGDRPRKVPRPLIRREPAPERGALRRGGSALSRALEGGEAARQGAVVQQRARPRRREAALDEFDQAACVIVKHNNPCGVAIADPVAEAYEKALACDPLSAYGGVIALNRGVDQALAERLHEHFLEVVIAPFYEPHALDVLTQKEAVRILEAAEQRGHEARERDVKRVRGGLLVQDPDRIDEERESMRVVTEARPGDAQWEDLWFAWKVCRHVRSNAIVIAKDGATLGIGAGQMSRVDSVRIAIDKAREARGTDAPAYSPVR